MRTKRLLIAISIGCGVAMLGGVAHAQDYGTEDYGMQADRDMFLIEATGSYGFQLGETDFLPDGSFDEWRHPLVNGFGVGGAVGWILAPQVALVGTYEYNRAWSRDGDVQGILDNVDGMIDYHTATVGLRLYHPAGPGRLRTEFGLGVVFPYETELEFEYGPALAQAGITGTGTRVENFGLGYGGYGMVGYELPVAGPLYVAANIKIKAFQSENDGEETELRNFVTDFEETPPTAVTADIEHGDGDARPSTNSVQDARFQLALGARF